MPTIAARSVLALTAVALIAATVLTLTRKGSLIAGSNGVPPSVFVVTVPPRARVCQVVVPLPSRATTVRVTAATFGKRGGRLSAEFPPAAVPGRVTRIDEEGVLDVRLPRSRTQASQLCIVNRGVVRVALAGVATPPTQGARVGRRPVRGAFSVAYLVDRSETWGDRGGAILDRVGFAKGISGGSATGVALILLLVGTLLGALVTSWRALRL